MHKDSTNHAEKTIQAPGETERNDLKDLDKEEVLSNPAKPAKSLKQELLAEIKLKEELKQRSMQSNDQESPGINDEIKTDDILQTVDENTDKSSAIPENNADETGLNQKTSDVFQDPINFELLDESKVDKIIRRRVSDVERYTFIFYKADDFGEVKLEAYRQTISESGEVILEFEEHREMIPELVTHKDVLDAVMQGFVDKRTLEEKTMYEDLTQDDQQDIVNEDEGVGDENELLSEDEQQGQNHICVSNLTCHLARAF